MSLALELSSRRCIIFTQCCGYSKQPWVQLFPMLASIKKSISSSWLGFLLSVVNLLQCSLLHCNLKFLDCKLSLKAHAANVSPNRSIFGKYVKTITIKWKSADKTIVLSTGQKFIHFKIKINVLKEKCTSNALLVEKTYHSSKLHATSVLV